jgi:hypothetical protein
MVASALAAKSAVLPAAANNHALYWSSESHKFVSVYADVADKLAFSFADVEAFAASLGSYDAATKRLSVEGVEFDLSTKVPSTKNVLRFENVGVSVGSGSDLKSLRCVGRRFLRRA